MLRHTPHTHPVGVLLVAEMWSSALPRKIHGDGSGRNKRGKAASERGGLTPAAGRASRDNFDRGLSKLGFKRVAAKCVGRTLPFH